VSIPFNLFKGFLIGARGIMGLIVRKTIDKYLRSYFAEANRLWLLSHTPYYSIGKAGAIRFANLFC
jgi:hypothetical protein